MLDFDVRRVLDGTSIAHLATVLNRAGATEGRCRLSDPSFRDGSRLQYC